MKCINCEFLAMNPLSSKPSQFQHKHILWLAKKWPGELEQSRNKFFSVSCAVRTNALPSSKSIFLTAAVSSPGNVPGLLVISAFLLFAYWITNFVVPELILKDLRSRLEADQSSPEDDLGDKPERKT